MKKYSEYNHFRTNKFPYYYDIAEIVGDTQAAGNYAYSSQTAAAAAPTTAPDNNGESGEGDQDDNSEHGGILDVFSEVLVCF